MHLAEALGKLYNSLQLYMIMALMAALLMRLRCFLLRRRGEAGLNGVWRADDKTADGVERAVLNVVGFGLC